MPDRWGRPTMSDGLALFQGLRTMESDMERREDRETEAAFEDETYKAVQAMEEGGNLAGVSPKARATAMKIYWDNRYGQVRTEAQERANDAAFMQNKIATINMRLKEADEVLKQYKTARFTGDDQQAYQLAAQLNNQHMYNGLHVEPHPDGSYMVTRFGRGDQEKVEPMPLKDVDQAIGMYFDRDYDDIMKWSLTAEENRRLENDKKFANPQKLINDKGDWVYKIEAGVWDPEGKPRGEFYVKDPHTREEIPAEMVRAGGYRPIEEAKGLADIQSKKAAAAANYENVRKSRRIDPQKTVGLDTGERGLMMMGKEGPEVQTIKDSKNIKEQPAGTGDAAKEEREQYKHKQKMLSDQLRLFSKKSDVMVDEEGNLTTVGNNTLEDAANLLRQAASGKALTQQESEMLPYAETAWRMYQELTKTRKKAFGLQTGNQRQVGGVTPPPPDGFIVDMD